MAQRSDGTMEEKSPGGAAPVPEGCPHCQSKEVDSAGKCQVCGHKIREEKSAAEPLRTEGAFGAEGAVNVEFSTPMPEEGGEVPEWRHELSRRLLEIKRRRGESVPEAPEAPKKTLPFPHTEQAVKPVIKAVADAPLRHEPARARPVPSAAQDKIVRLPERSAGRPQRSAKKPGASLPLFQPARLKAGAKTGEEADLKRIPKVTDPDPAALQELLDSIVLRQTQPEVAPPRTAGAAEEAGPKGADRLILLSRTLSGFMDLSIVVLLTSAFILSADFFSGIEMIDTVSKAWYAALLLATYALYSAFFLGTANQTIGMMIKDLRVVGDNGRRLKLKQVLTLSAAYLLSMFACGLGLLWACFDRETRCLHDRLSHTRVVRL